MAQPLLFQCIVTNLHLAHDTLFKFCFSDAVRAAEEFRAILPPNLVRKIDWAALERIDGSFVDETLTQLHSDLLFSTKINGSPGLIYLLFEHQSHAEPLMPYRMLRYVDRALWSHVSANRNALPLPAVIPILLHHSESGWTNATSMHQLFDESLVADEAIARLLPQLHLVVDDLSHLSDAELRVRAMGQVTKMMLWLLRDARNPTKFRVSLERWIGIFAEVSGAPCGMDALRVAYTYIAEVADVTPQELIELAKLHKVPQAEEQLMTMAQQWLNEGIEKGIEKGMEKGIEKGKTEGRAEGRTQTLLDQLTLKFGPVSDEIRARVTEAGELELTRWIGGILSAQTLGELFD